MLAPLHLHMFVYTQSVCMDIVHVQEAAVNFQVIAGLLGPTRFISCFHVHTWLHMCQETKSSVDDVLYNVRPTLRGVFVHDVLY